MSLKLKMEINSKVGDNIWTSLYGSSSLKSRKHFFKTLLFTQSLPLPQAVGTPLMSHQRQALSWMCAQENKSSLPPFWEKRGDLYHNVLTCFSSKEVPERVRGGILADDMGLVSNTRFLVIRSLDVMHRSVESHHKTLYSV